MSEFDRKKYWTSLDQLNDSEGYRKDILDRYRESKELPKGLSRRSFMTLLGASMALAGLAGCRKPVEKIVPYVTQPEEVTPGVPSHYATSMPVGTSAVGLVVESHEGRPTKIEGNESHPSSLGSTDIWTQAETLGLYDPDRSKTVLNDGAESDFSDFVGFWRGLYERYLQNGGEGLAILSEPFSSPTLARLKAAIEDEFPKARWVGYEPFGDDNIYRAARTVTGRRTRPVYTLDNANIILALDSDFLWSESDRVRNTRKFADGRRLEDTGGEMNRLYCVEGMLSVTGSSADHRLKVRRSDIGRFLNALAGVLSTKGVSIAGVAKANPDRFDAEWIDALADDLIQAGKSSLIVAGRSQPRVVHEQVFRINAALGAVGNTISFATMPHATVSDVSELGSLIDDMNSGAVETLLILGGNPVYNAPRDLNFAAAMNSVKNTVHFSQFVDETSAIANWHIPRSHFLESWGDTTDIHGMQSVIQPLIAPLYRTRSDAELYSLIATGLDVRGYDIVRETWKDIVGGTFEKGWRRVLHDGYFEGHNPVEQLNQISAALSASSPGQPDTASDGLEIQFAPSILYDGRYANNAWLLELPDPISKLAWDNAALMSPKTARDLGLSTNEIAKIEFDGRSIDIPVMTVPGVADNTIVLPAGFGRSTAGKVGSGVGIDVLELRGSKSMYAGVGAQITATGLTHKLVTTQDHGRMAGRPIVREASLEEYRKHPDFAKEAVEHPPLKNMYEPFDYSKGYQWGMVIDLNTCIGCGACTIACQSENNIQPVGREQVSHGREMHWIRNDRYFTGSEEEPEVVFMPVPCQHCENAPCESVCPVNATQHDEEGLNVMTYNRCIGTRYCSNNCPYKVRRFNFFNYIDGMPETTKMAQNPDVTVRSRGVMEKCTFCIQRINRTKQKAKMDGRRVRDGELKTACQQVCPAKAITFGNINQDDSEVTRKKSLSRNYDLLGEFNVRPRNSYLAKVRNRNPRLAARYKDGDEE